MHEMGIAMQIVEIASASIPPNLKGTPVEKINLKIGKLTAIVPESLKFCFDIVIQNTVLSGAKLIICEIPVSAKCRKCDNEWIIKETNFICPNCNSGSIDICSGREMNIESIEIAN